MGKETHRGWKIFEGEKKLSGRRERKLMARGENMLPRSML